MPDLESANQRSNKISELNLLTNFWNLDVGLKFPRLQFTISPFPDRDGSTWKAVMAVMAVFVCSRCCSGSGAIRLADHGSYVDVQLLYKHLVSS